MLFPIRNLLLSTEVFQTHLDTDKLFLPNIASILIDPYGSFVFSFSKHPTTIIMLVELLVKNVALIESVELTFGHALNIITGETGAGKSIIVDSLMAVLGERISTEMIRAGEQKAIIEGVFTITGHPKIPVVLKEHDYESSGEQLILRREISLKGGSRCFINDTPAPLQLLREIGIQLVDFHGQHEHQSLLRAETHRIMLDNIGGLETIVEEYRKYYQALSESVSQLESLVQREKELLDKQEYQRFQFNEINSIEPQIGEDQRLEQELTIIENSERLHEQTFTIYQILYGDDSSVRDNLTKVRNMLERLKSIDPQFEQSALETDAVIVAVDEIAKFAQNYNSHLEFYPERLEEIRERLIALTRLKKKYGSLDKAIEFRDELEREILLIENFEGETTRLQTKIDELQRKLGAVGVRLTAKRKEIAKNVEKSIVAMLASLGIPSATFVVMMEQEELMNGLFEPSDICAVIGNKKFRAFEHGLDKVHFYISTNKGEEPKPLEKVVSGGEASRIMLSIKSILAKSDRLPMLVFDEIDSGISGRISQKVGLAMKDLASYHQIIAITHQPQIAALADTHIAVQKQEKNGRVTVSATVLERKERVQEVAKLLSGEDVTTASLKSARELITAGENSSSFSATAND